MQVARRARRHRAVTDVSRHSDVSRALDRGGDLRGEDRPPRRFRDDIAGQRAAAADKNPLQHIREFRVLFGPQQRRLTAAGFATRILWFVCTHWETGHPTRDRRFRSGGTEIVMGQYQW